jgi:hypothetical protein
LIGRIGEVGAGKMGKLPAVYVCSRPALLRQTAENCQRITDLRAPITSGAAGKAAK